MTDVQNEECKIPFPIWHEALKGWGLQTVHSMQKQVCKNPVSTGLNKYAEVKFYTLTTKTTIFGVSIYIQTVLQRFFSKIVKGSGTRPIVKNCVVSFENCEKIASFLQKIVKKKMFL